MLMYFIFALVCIGFILVGGDKNGRLGKLGEFELKEDEDEESERVVALGLPCELLKRGVIEVNMLSPSLKCVTDCS